MKIYRTLTQILLQGLVWLALPIAAFAQLVVTSPTDDGSAGTLRQAINNATNGATITFAQNLSGLTILVNSTLNLTNSLTIDATSLLNGIQISGQGAVGVFSVTSTGNVVLNSLTIANGSANNGLGGGAIYNTGTAMLNRCTITGNTAIDLAGGGVYNLGTMVMTQCLLTGNTAPGGGAIDNQGTMTVNQCTVANNGAYYYGGGIYAYGGTLTVNKCILTGNSTAAYGYNAYSYGGGIYNWGSTVTVNESTLSGNYSTYYGGGIATYEGSTTLNQSTLYGNSAQLAGGIYIFYSTLTNFNSIIAGNAGTAGGGGGDIWNDSGGTMFLSGTNIIQDIYNSSSTNAIMGGPPVNIAPGLAALGNYGGPTQTMPPTNGSPAIDAGSDSATNLFATDQRGFPRLYGKHVDIGAIEVQPTVQFSCNPSNGVVPLTVNFTSPAVDSMGNTIANWNWTFGDGSTSTARNPSYTYTVAGAFQPVLIATNSQGHLVLGYGPGIVAEQPSVQFTASPTNGLSPLTVQFNSSNVDTAGNTIIGWNWNFGDGSTSAIQDPSHTFTVIGLFTPTLVATNNHGTKLIGYGPQINVSTYFTFVTTNGAIWITGYTGPGGTVAIPGTINNLPVTGIENNAFQYDSLTNVIIPDTVTNIGAAPFLGCGGLMAINVQPDNPAYASSGGVLFNKSGTLLVEYPLGMAGTSYIIPGTVTSIGEDAFSSCALTNIVIQNNVTNIAFGAFQGSSLTSVTIPNRVMNIGSYAFSDCWSLMGTYFQGNAPSADTTVFSGDYDLFAAYYIVGTTGWGPTFAGVDTIEVPANCQIAVSASPSAGGTVGGSGTFAPGSWQTVTASANSGYSFNSWTENGIAVSLVPNYSFTVSGNVNLIATFSANPLTYNVAVSASPGGGGTVAGGGTFVSGTSQTVTATANNGYTFANWTENGSAVSSSASYTFTLSGNRNLVANFTSTPFVMYVPGAAGSIMKITSAGVQSTLVSVYTFGGPSALAVDTNGNLYVADGAIYKVTPAGVMSTFASGFSEPTGLAFDSSGNLYVADFGNGTISKVTPAGVVSTFATGFTSDPHLGGNGTLSVACDGNGNVFLADYDAGTVSKITPARVVSVFADGMSYLFSITTDPGGNVFVADFYGTVTKFTPAGAVSTLASVSWYATGLAFDSGGNLYVSHVGNNAIAEVTSAGVVSTFVSGYSGPIAIFPGPNPPTITTQPLNQGLIAGQAVPAVFSAAAGGQNIGYQWNVSTNGGTTWTQLANGSTYSGTMSATLTVENATPAFSGYEYECVAANAVGSATSSPAVLTNVPFLLYVADEINNTVSTLTPDGHLTLLSGGLSHPLAIASDAAGNIYVANQGNNTVSMISTAGGASTFASGFYQPDALAFDGSGNLYVANALTDPSTISKVTPAGVVSTFASGFAYPSALAFDRAGNLYVANPGNNTVSKVTPAGVVSTFASGFGYPTSLAFDGGGNLYVANWTSNTVSEVTPAGVVSTFASGFNGPMGLAFDGSGNLYVANYANSTVSGTISKVTPAGVVTTFFGNLSDLVAISAVTAPAPPTITIQPQSVTLPAGENAVFSIDVSGAPGLNTFQWQVSTDGGATWLPLSNNAIYSGVASPTLTVTGTISGYEFECVVTNAQGSATSNPAILTHLPFLMYAANASSSSVSAITPAGAASTFASGVSGALAVDNNGNLYVANEGSGMVSKVTPAGMVSTFASGFNEPIALACDTSGNLYVANEGNGTISKVTPAGMVSTFASRFGDPTALACDANGNLYVADYDYSTVSKITPGGVDSLYASEVFNPNGLAFDASGNLYEADVAGLIIKITTGGVETTYASGLYDPDGLAFDGSGNLYVINGNGPVSMITPRGVVSTFVSALGDLTSVAIVTAPVLLTAGNYTVAVSALPSAGGTVSGGGAFPAGSPSLQTVTATANSGYAFVNWTEDGKVVSSLPTYSFTLSGNVSLVATFYKISYQTLDEPLATAPSSGGTYAAGISGGDIVGYYTSPDGYTYGFLYNSNVYTTLEDPNANGYTAASGISDGNIVGNYSDGSWHGFLYSGGTYTTYSYLAGSGSLLFGIANGIDGTNVVGAFSDDNGIHGVLFNGSTYKTLDDPNSYPIYELGYLSVGTDTSANGISGGSIVGSYNDSAGSGEHGFMYTNGNYTTLDDPNGFGSTCASGIDGGNIVGYYTDGNHKTHGFLYSGANYTTLDDPNGVGSTYALGISGNTIVGYYTDSNNVAHGFIATLTIGFNANPTNGTVPLAVQFTSPRVDGDGNLIAFWNWNFGDGSTSTNENPSHIYTNPGTFLLSLVVTNSLGFAVPVYGPASITASLPTIQYAVNQTNGPAPLTVQFTSSGIDLANNIITHWNWNFGDGSSSTNQNPTHVYTNAGTFLPSLVATNSLGVTVIGVGPSLIVANPVEYFGLVLNGGFESGDFTGWSESGNFDYCSIASNSTCVYSGHYGAELGPVGSLGYISQTLSTLPGQSYLLSLWLDSPDGQYPNEFLVFWNGNILFDETNLPATGWTNLQLTVSATRSNATLEFGFRNDPSYFGLDAISVTAISASPLRLYGVGFNSNFTFQVSGPAGSNYVLQASTNLLNWNPVNTSTIPVNGTINLTNATSGYKQRFYRVHLQ